MEYSYENCVFKDSLRCGSYKRLRQDGIYKISDLTNSVDSYLGKFQLK